MFSGLTLGLLSLDPLGLDIIIQGSENEEDRKNAATILTLRKDGNMLLCTLLFGNVVVNAELSILSADVFDGMVGLIASTFTIVIFGEIIPQAVCQRYALYIGAKAVPLVTAIKYIFYPITKPISFVLNKVLGEDIGTIYTRGQMQALFKAYVSHGEMNAEEAGIMTGAITYKDKLAKDVMTPFKNIFCLKDTDRLDFATLSKIFKSGFSRLPVISGHGNRWEDVQGMLLTKDLIMIDPDEGHNVMAAVQLFNRRVGQCYPDSKLSEVLADFKSGTSHLCMVVDVNNSGDGDPYYEVQGVLTMEDIIEEILQAEIVDETDVFVHMENTDSKIQRDSFDFARLRLIDTGLTLKLTKSEITAVQTHLNTNVAAFRDEPRCTQAALEWCLENSAVLNIEAGELRAPKVLYKRETVETFFTLILSGNMLVLAGRDEVRVEYGAFQSLGDHALLVPEGEYKPDFTATIETSVRCLRIARDTYMKAITAPIVDGKLQVEEDTAKRRRTLSKESARSEENLVVDVKVDNE